LRSALCFFSGRLPHARVKAGLEIQSLEYAAGRTSFNAHTGGATAALARECKGSLQKRRARRFLAPVSRNLDPRIRFPKLTTSI
jgi:hypothetical protein